MPTMLTHNDDRGEPRKARDETAATKIGTLIEVGWLILRNKRC